MANLSNILTPSGLSTLTGTENLSGKTLIDPKLQLSGSTGQAKFVPVSQGAGTAPVWGFAPVNVIPITVDFGSTVTYSKIFTVTNPEATTSSKIMCTQTAGVNPDETEMDPIIVSAACLDNGQVTFYANALAGPVKGTKYFVYIVG
jgi:hypothetical protein